MLRKYILYISYLFTCLFVTGYFALAAGFSSNLSVFIISILAFLSSYFVKEDVYFKKKMLFILPYAIYYILVIEAKGSIINSLLPAVIMASCGMLTKKYRNYLSIPMLLVVYWISFYGAPHAVLDSNKIKLTEHKISEFVFLNSSDNMDTLTCSGCTMIETWGKGCGQCFHAMKDMESFFEALETEYKFNHEYIYIGELNNKDREKFRSHNYLENQGELYCDIEKIYYKKAGMQGYPFFNLYNDKGQLVFSQVGYLKKYDKAYIRQFRKLVNLHCAKTSIN